MRALLLVLGLGFPAALLIVSAPAARAAAPALRAATPRSPGPRVPTQGAEDQYRFVLGLSEQRLWTQVVREARAFLAEHPRDERADQVRYRLGAALAELGRTKEAIDELEALARRRGFQLWREAAYRLAQCLLTEGETSRAIEALERLLAGGADYLEQPASLSLADARLETGDFAGAEHAYLFVARSVTGPEDSETAADAAWGLAWCAYRLEQGDDVLERTQNFLARYGGDERVGEMFFLRGEVLLERGRNAEALEAYRSVRSGPFVSAALRGSGFALASSGRHADAARAFDGVLERDSGALFGVECALHAGVEHLKAGATALALKRLQRSELDDDPEALYWRARAQTQAGRHAEALVALERGLARRPEAELEARIRSARGDALSALGRKDEAVRAWEGAGSNRGLHNAAVASLNAGRHREAAELAERLLSQGGTDAAGRVELALVLGEARFALEDYAAAEQAFVQALGVNENAHVERPHAELRVAWCRWFANDATGAAERFARVAEAGAEESAEAQFMLARARLASGDESGAARAFRGYLERYPEGPKHADALLALSRLEPGGAGMARLEALLQAHPASALAPEARLELAERYADGGDRERALLLYEKIQRGPHGPEVAPARYGLAWCRYEAGAYDEAAVVLRALLEQEDAPQDLVPVALELLVWCEIERGDRDRALAAWTALMEAVPDATRWMGMSRKLIELLRAAGETEAARSVLARLVALEQERPDARCAAGLAVEAVFLELDVGHVAEAEAAFRQAVGSAGVVAQRGGAGGDTVARITEAAFFVGEACFEAGDFERAAALYDAACASPDAAVAERALYKGGFARLSQGDASGAAERFQRLVDEHPKSTLRLESIFLIGEAQFRAGRFEEAAANLERLRRTARKHAVMPKALFRLGLAYGELERWKDSAEVLTQLAQEYGDFANLAQAELWRGRAHARLGDGAAARRALARVLALERGDLAAQARVELGLLARAEEDLDGALSEFLKVAVLYETETVAIALLLAGQVLEEQGAAQAAAGRYRELVEGYPESTHAAAARARLNELRER